MVGFNNAVGQSSTITNIQQGNDNQIGKSNIILLSRDGLSPALIAFGRGSIGFVALNNVGSIWTATFSTSLPDGTCK